MTAETVKHYGVGFFEALNAGTLTPAKSGAALPASAAQSGSGTAVFNLYGADGVLMGALRGVAAEDSATSARLITQGG